MTYSNFHVGGGKIKTTVTKRVQGPPATPGKDQGGGHFVAKSTAADAAYHATIDQKSSWAADSARNNPAALEHERRHVRIQLRSPRRWPQGEHGLPWGLARAALRGRRKRTRDGISWRS